MGARVWQVFLPDGWSRQVPRVSSPLMGDILTRAGNAVGASQGMPHPECLCRAHGAGWRMPKCPHLAGDSPQGPLLLQPGMLLCGRCWSGCSQVGAALVSQGSVIWHPTTLLGAVETLRCSGGMQSHSFFLAWGARSSFVGFSPLVLSILSSCRGAGGCGRMCAAV